MNLKEKIERSRSTERLDFSKYQSIDKNDQLVRIETNAKILVEPCWMIENDWEGERYRDYIKKHPAYNGVYIRSELAKRLQVAVLGFDDKYRMVIRAGHRPIEVQRRILIDCAD